MERTCWTTGSWRCCLGLEVVSSIPAGSMMIYRFLCGFICVSLSQGISIKLTNMYIANARGQFKINTHGCWTWHQCIPDGLSVVQCSLGPVIEIVFFLHNFIGIKRTCWTTGSWWCCLGLEFVSSIPAGSTVIYRFLCGFICVSLCQGITIKLTNMYIASARGQFKIARLLKLTPVHSRRVVSCPVQPRPCHWDCGIFLHNFIGMKRPCWTTVQNWQLVVLPRSGGREFNPRRVHDNLSFSLWVCMRFPLPEHQN